MLLGVAALANAAAPQIAAPPADLFKAGILSPVMPAPALKLAGSDGKPLSLERFLKLDGPPTFFTNQTMTHLTMRAHGARALDSKKFVLQLDDQFVYRDRYASREIVLRHYVNPVRHKFWTALWG